MLRVYAAWFCRHQLRAIFSWDRFRHKMFLNLWLLIFCLLSYEWPNPFFKKINSNFLMTEIFVEWNLCYDSKIVSGWSKTCSDKLHWLLDIRKYLCRTSDSLFHLSSTQLITTLSKRKSKFGSICSRKELVFDVWNGHRTLE